MKPIATSSTREEIAKIANETRERMNLKVPINLDEFLPSLQSNFSIKCKPKTHLGNNIAMRFKKPKKGEIEGIEIDYLSRNSPNHKLFFLCHALGHITLHLNENAKYRENSDGSYKLVYSIDLELEANEFAAAFLMPEKEFKEEVEKHRRGNKIDIHAIAHHFNVTSKIALVRGNVLDLW